MKFKIDENLPVEVGALLTALGHDVCTVPAEGLTGTADQRLAAVCRAEDRVIITLDTDFADIRTYPPAQSPGIVVLRLHRQDRPHVLQVVARLRQKLSTEPLRGRLWLVEESRIRIRE